MGAVRWSVPLCAWPLCDCVRSRGWRGGGGQLTEAVRCFFADCSRTPFLHNVKYFLPRCIILKLLTSLTICTYMFQAYALHLKLLCYSFYYIRNHVTKSVCVTMSHMPHASSLRSLYKLISVSRDGKIPSICIIPFCYLNKMQIV